MFPGNRQKLKKRKYDLHEISSASPKAGMANTDPRGSRCDPLVEI